MRKSEIDLDGTGQSSIELQVVEIKDKEKKKKKKLLQRVEKWFKMRAGKFTGSEISNLMSCGPGVTKLTWDDLDKLFSFGETSLKSIYGNAKERQSGKYVNTGDGVFQMKYGAIVEPLIQKYLTKHFKDVGKLKEVGFKSFDTFENAGSSADMVLFIKKIPDSIVEIKATTTWDSHYKKSKTYDIKHSDFWQTQSEMISWNVKKGYFVYSEPPKDILDYIYFEGTDKELYKKFIKECPITIVPIERDVFHQRVLFKRLKIAEKALKEYIQTKEDIRDCLNKAIGYFHQFQNELSEDFPEYLKVKNVVKK